MSEFTDQATSLETDIEIMEAIESLTTDQRTPQMIWEDPNKAELAAIRAAVPSGLCWGALGDGW